MMAKMVRPPLLPLVASLIAAPVAVVRNLMVSKGHSC